MIEIKKESDEAFIFVLKAESGGTLLNSVSFSSKKEAEEAIRHLKSLLGRLNVFERTTNHNGQFLYGVKNAQGQIIGRSELYSSEAGMENGIKNLKNRIAQLSEMGEL